MIVEKPTVDRHKDDKGSSNQSVEDRQDAPRNQLLTVVVEDYFHVAPLKSVVQADRWYRFERRVESNTRKALDLLDEYGVKATFFVLGSIADEMPELVREIADRGHEVASKGYFHHSIGHFGREEFRDDVARSREALENAAGAKIHGFRIGHRWFSTEDLWALDVLAEEGFAYDSSVRPLFRQFAREPWRIRPHRHRHNGLEIVEFPLTSWSVLGWSIPISGGNYFRQFPHSIVRRGVASWVKEGKSPFLMYFHVWELDPDQPRIQAAPWKERVRQYRNLDRMEKIVRDYLGEYKFVGIADHLRLSHSSQDMNLNAVVHRIHVLRGFKGGWEYTAWAVMYDTSCFAMILFAITGIIMWFKRRKQFKHGWWYLLAGILIPVFFIYAFVLWK